MQLFLCSADNMAIKTNTFTAGGSSFRLVNVNRARLVMTWLMVESAGVLPPSVVPCRRFLPPPRSRHCFVSPVITRQRVFRHALPYKPWTLQKGPLQPLIMD